VGPPSLGGKEKRERLLPARTYTNVPTKSRPVPWLYWRSAIGERPYPPIMRFPPSSWPLGCRDFRGPSRRPFPGLGSIDHRGGRCRNTKDVELIDLTAEPPPGYDRLSDFCSVASDANRTPLSGSLTRQH
jgi:hypothetical protein